LETVLRRERLIIGGCLAAMVALAWLYLVHTKTAMPDMDMPGMVMLDSKWGPTVPLLRHVDRDDGRQMVPSANR
jgi:predicted metal-binding membrane protein